MISWCSPSAYFFTKKKKNSYETIHIEHFKDSRDYYFHGGLEGEDKGHYGDHILNLKFFYNISPLLEKERITIHYYYNPKTIKNPIELERYVNPKTMILDTLDKMTYGVELWMGRNFLGVDYNILDTYYRVFYKDILEQIKLTQPIDTGLYQREDYLHSIYKRLPSCFSSLDILILNNIPIASKFDYHSSKAQFDTVCKQLSKRYKIATLIEVDETIPSTMNHKLTIQDIGAISTRSKNIIGFFSGPINGCFNKATKDYVKTWILLDPRAVSLEEVNCYTLPTIDFDQLQSLIKIE